MLENSPKRMAIYMKVQLAIKSITLSDTSKKTVGKKLKKACQTRWLSFHAATSAIFDDYLAVLQTLRKLKDEDGVEYIWNGGVGKENNIVAYSSICPHQMTHINKNDTFISYLATGKKSMACKSCPHHVRHGVVAKDGVSIEFKDVSQKRETRKTYRLYFFLNLSILPAASTLLSEPVKNG